MFSFFTVAECIALLIKTYQYIINTSCSSLTTVLLPDFCTGKTKDDWTYSSEVSPVIDFTDSRNRRKLLQEGKFMLRCFHFWLTVFWSRWHQGTPCLMHAKYSSHQLEKSGNQGATPELYQKHHLAFLLPYFSGVQDICLRRSCIVSPS